MRILTTGHLGYIGTVAVPLLQQAGHEVVGMDTDLYRDSTFGPDPGPAARIPNLGIDIRDATPDHLSGFDAVLHLGGIPNDPLGDLDPDVTMQINAEATVSLARAAKRAGIGRFVFSSSCSNYGASGGDRLLDEDAPFNPVTPYGRSKVEAERGLLPLSDDRFSPVLMRSATAFGVSPRLRFDLVINNLTAWAVATGDILLKSDGTPWRAVVHVEDIARAFLAVLEAPREAVHGQAFNVASAAENYRVLDIARMVEEEVKGARIRFADGAGPDLRCYRVQGAKLARAFPRAIPRRGARDGIAELHAAFRAHSVGAEEFEGPRFHRKAHVLAHIGAGRIGPDLRRRASGAARAA